MTDDDLRAAQAPEQQSECHHLWATQDKMGPYCAACGRNWTPEMPTDGMLEMQALVAINESNADEIAPQAKEKTI